MYHKRTYNEWVSIVDDVFNVPERIDTLSIVELKEMLLHLEKRHYFLHKGIMHRVSVETAHPSFGTAQHLEYCRKYNSQGGYNIIGIENMMAFVKGRIERYNKIIDDPIFEPNIAKDFFEYCIDEWVLNVSNKKTILSLIFHKMWHENDLEDCIYKIKVNQSKFARFFNAEYSLKTKYYFNNPKKPNLRTNINSPSYDKQFKRMLDTFSL